MKRLSRIEATKRLVSHLTNELVVANLGNATYDLFAAGDRPGNLYTWGCMGLVSSLGLGLALARPDRRVVVLDGDGSLLMNLGSLATVGTRRPANLIWVVWDNEQNQLTGGQPTATAAGADLVGMARAAGIARAEQYVSAADLEAAFKEALVQPGPWFLVAKTDASGAAGPRPPRDPVLNKHRLLEGL